jgi:DNA-binding response OmpR family regulator
MYVAVAETDPVSAHVLTMTLKRRGHVTTSVPSAEHLLKSAPYTPNLAIIGLGHVNGSSLGLVEQLRSMYPGIIVFVISDQMTDLAAIAALRAGACDAIRRPYNPMEVTLRAEAWLSLARPPIEQESLARAGDIEVDLYSYTARKNGRLLRLTRTELRILYCLCIHQRLLTPTDRLLMFTWGPNEEPDISSLKSHLSHLRQKLRSAGGAQVEIRSHHGIGYELCVGTADQQ